MTLGVDYAWTHPDPKAIKAGGYTFVLRYFSHDATKDLTAAEVQALHAAGLSVGVVWETTETRATQGQAAGAQDRAEAEARAKALGYPTSAPIFYAVDADVDPATVLDYFRGVAGGAHPVGVYGSKRVVEGVVAARLAVYAWQTQAWSGTTVSPIAHLYQRVKPTGSIAASVAGSWDEDVALKAVPLWAPASTAAQQLNAAYVAWRAKHPGGTPTQFANELRAQAAHRAGLGRLHAAFLAWRAKHPKGTAAQFAAALRALRRK